MNTCKTAYSYVCGFLFLAVLSACSTTLEITQIRQSNAIASFKPVKLTVPFYPQDEYQCGPAALAMLLNWSDVKVEPADLVPLVYVPEKQGSFPLEIVAATRQYERLPYVIKPSFTALIDELQAGNPVLVFQNLALDWFPKWHFAVVTGVDLAANQIYLNSGTIQDHKMTLEQFERTWMRAKKWAMVAVEAGQLPASAEPLGVLKAAVYFEQQGKLQLARSFYQSATKRWPEEVLVLMAMANVSYQLGMLDNAIDYFRKTIKLDERYAPAHNNLANALMEQGRLSEALRHAEVAVNMGGKRVELYRQTLFAIKEQLASKTQ